MQRHQAPGFLSQTEPMMCSTQLKGQRWQAGRLNLIFSHLDSTHPLPFMIIKPIDIEKLYREDCHIKLARISSFRSIVPLQKKEGIMSSVEHDVLLCHTNLLNHQPSLVVRAKQQKSIMCYLAFWQRNFKNVNMDKICSPMAYRLARYSPILTTSGILHKHVLIKYQLIFFFF